MAIRPVKRPSADHASAIPAVAKPAPAAPPTTPVISATAPVGAVSHSRIRIRQVFPEQAAAPVVAEPANDPPLKRAHHKVDRTTDNWDENGDYIVGKGRPPMKPRWVKGQSGNPRGPKPREPLSREAELDALILGEFNVKRNGQDMSIHLGTFSLDALKAIAAKGNRGAAETLFKLYEARVRATSREAVSIDLNPEEMAAIEQILTDAGLAPSPVAREARRSGDTDPEQRP